MLSPSSDFTSSMSALFSSRSPREQIWLTWSSMPEREFSSSTATFWLVYTERRALSERRAAGGRRRGAATPGCDPA